MAIQKRPLFTSVAKKQIVAVTGVFFIVFLLGHLGGNFLIFKSPAAINHYAEFLKSLRPGLTVVEAFFGLVFLVHVLFTAALVIENRRARGAQDYGMRKTVGDRSWATRTMPYTGTLILVFLISHLLDFTFARHDGAACVLKGQDMGLYGLIINTFSDPVQAGFYSVVMFAIGFHLSHAVQSCFQTFGIYHNRYTPLVRLISLGIGLFLALAYSSIPMVIYINSIAR